MRQRHRTWARLALAATLPLLVATACTNPRPNDRERPETRTVRILASSELSDMKGLLARSTAKTGVRAKITWSGTLDATRQVASGEADKRYDGIWLATNDYLRLNPAAARRIATETPVMTSPVALGIRTTALDRLGWKPEKVTWKQVHQAASAGELTFGMTDPARSNSGYSALISVASALSGAQSALTAKDVEGSAKVLREFFTGQRLTAGSSGWLASSFADRPDVDALINYESVLLSLDRDNSRTKKAGSGRVTVIRPVDGAVTARYPLTALSSASSDAQEALRDLTSHLRGEEAQREITRRTLRRPVNTAVAPAEEIPAGRQRELPYPGSLATADGLLDAYHQRIRRPSRTMYVLDTSQSMAGKRLAELKSALRTLTGGKGGTERFRDRERVTLMPFATKVVDAKTHTVEPANRDAALARINRDAAALTPHGQTAVYHSLTEAYRALAKEDVRDSFTSIVLMTDGENNQHDVTAADFEKFHANLSADLRNTPVFTVHFGDADRAELARIAKVTGGRLFDAVDSSLDQAFREIRGYQ